MSKQQPFIPPRKTVIPSSSSSLSSVSSSSFSSLPSPAPERVHLGAGEYSLPGAEFAGGQSSSRLDIIQLMGEETAAVALTPGQERELQDIKDRFGGGVVRFPGDEKKSRELARFAKEERDRGDENSIRLDELASRIESLERAFAERKDPLIRKSLAVYSMELQTTEDSWRAECAELLGEAMAMLLRMHGHNADFAVKTWMERVEALKK